MAEPITTAGTAGGVKAFIDSVLFKFLLSPYFAACIASVIVMVMTMPKTKKQQMIALLVTFISSIYGGAFVLDYFTLNETLTTVSKGGIYLVAGIPAWVIVRGFFAYTERDQNKSIIDYIKEIKDAWKS